MADSDRKNWGRCSNGTCNLVWGPRCNQDLCIKCCELLHCYWLGHVMADGSDSTATTKVAERAGHAVTHNPLPAVYGGTSNQGTYTPLTPLPPPKPKVPEPGKLEEIEEGTILPTPDNGYGSRGGKSGFPVTYAK